jgi:hypothetical protein
MRDITTASTPNTPDSHFPEGNFSYIPHPLSLHAPVSHPQASRRLLLVSSMPNFHLQSETEDGNVLVLEAAERKPRRGDINCDKKRREKKAKIGFVPSVINRKFAKLSQWMRRNFLCLTELCRGWICCFVVILDEKAKLKILR